MKDAGEAVRILEQFCFGTLDSMHAIKHLIYSDASSS